MNDSFFFFFLNLTPFKSCSHEDFLVSIHVRSVASTGWVGRSLKSSIKCWDSVLIIQMSEELSGDEQDGRQGGELGISTGVHRE